MVGVLIGYFGYGAAFLPGPGGHGFGLEGKALITRVRFALPKEIGRAHV